MPRVFHVEMAFFKTVGKINAVSGGPSMLKETDELSTGCLDAFLTEKHFHGR